MPTAAQYVSDLAAKGRYEFTTADAQRALGTSLPAVRASLRRLKRRREIADPHRGFHVIVPPEYRRLGCLPPDQFVPQLMDHLGEKYYVALLSAAELHGAAHQRPQTFQVMLAKNRRPLVCGAVHVTFVARRDLARTPVVEMNTPRGKSSWTTATSRRRSPQTLRGARRCSLHSCERSRPPARNATHAGSWPSMRSWSLTCDSEGLHNRVARGSSVGERRASRAGPRDQPCGGRALPR
jgi:hypothetical protein